MHCRSHNVIAGETGPGLWRQGWTIYLVGLMALQVFVPESAVLDWSMLYMSSDYGAGVAVSGLAFALFSACRSAMRFFGDAVRNRIGAVPLLCASAATAATGMTVAALAASTVIALAGFARVGIGMPILFSVAGPQGGANPGAAIAAVSFIGSGGMGLAPTVIGVTAEQTGCPAIFLALSGLFLSVAAFAPAVAPAPAHAVHAGSETGQA